MFDINAQEFNTEYMWEVSYIASTDCEQHFYISNKKYNKYITVLNNGTVSIAPSFT